MPRELLAAQTASGTSEEFTLYEPQFLPVSITAGGLAGAEVATLQYYDGAAWRDYYQDGNASPEQVTPTNSMITIYAPGRWRVTKSATVAAVAISMHSRSHP